MSSLTAKEIASCLREEGVESSRLLARGSGTKKPLWDLEETSLVEMSGFTGISEYDPSEYVFTARAGTKLSEIEQVLGEHGQYMPFDPPLAECGASLGGTVATGLSGPGRIRYGGLRDFILGVQFVDGNGVIVKSGGKVVKNAAGFDLPKFLAGSMGRLAILLELTFKVFPKPEDFLTICFENKTMADAFDQLVLASRSHWEPDALELEADGRLFLRLAGNSAALRLRAESILNKLKNGFILGTDGANEYWRKVSNFTWNGNKARYAKVPISPRDLLRLDAAVNTVDVECRYGMAANVAWLSWVNDGTTKQVDKVLRDLELSGLVLKGHAGETLIGHRVEYSIQNRVKAVFDPENRFPPLS